MAGVDALAARRGTLAAAPLAGAVVDFYLTNPIARASTIMAELSAIKAGAARERAQAAE